MARVFCPSPAEQPMVFESMLGRWNASDVGASFVCAHGERGNVAYADGCVKAEAKMPAPDVGLVKPRVSLVPRNLNGR